jgi:hypothetical protein
MNRTGVIKPGCLVLAALVLLAAAFAWKTIDFVVLKPAAVKAALNDVFDTVRGGSRSQIDQRRIRFLQNWGNYRDTTDNRYILRATSPVFDDDTVWIEYTDTMPIPILGGWVKTFRVQRLFV